MRVFFKKTNGIIAALLCAVIVLSLTVDFGKYAKKSSGEFDYSKFIQPISEESEEDVILSKNERLLRYTVSDSSMGYIHGDAVQVLESGEKSSYVSAHSNLNYRFVRWSDGKTEAKRRDTVVENTELKAEFEYIGFPAIYITGTSEIDDLTEEYLPVSVSLSNAEKEFSFDDSSANIRIRGNSSAKFEKKSFKIKFSEKKNLLGLGKAERKDWVLISNHCDQSLMRNYVAYNMAQSFDGLQVAYNSAHVDVYINGEYNGVYLLTEQVETGKSRVNVETEGTNDDIGFLLELDSREDKNSSSCILIDNLKFVIKSDFTTDGQYAYAKKYLEKCNEAIKKGDESEIESLVDVNSFVDMYILQEYVKNFDVGFASLFMYIEENGGKLFFGPAWDFDISMGNDDRIEDGGYEELFVGARRGFGIGHEWFMLAMEQKWFRDKVSERYTILYPIIKNKISDVVKYYLENKTELEENFDKWDIFGKRILFEPESVIVNDTHEEHFRYLVLWLNDRNEWLYEYFTSEEYKKAGEGFFDKLAK